MTTASDAPWCGSQYGPPTAAWKPRTSWSNSGADRTVFSASLLEKPGFPAVPAPAGLTLEGIGGESEFMLVNTSVRIHSDDGGGANMHGEFAAFIEVSTTEMSILGREILDHFDVILSRRRNEVLLLTKEHSYRVVSA